MNKSIVRFWLISVACALAGIPYAFELQRSVIDKAPVSTLVLVLVSVAQAAILLAIAVFAGAKLARSIGLRIFALHDLAPGTDKKTEIKKILKFGIPAGIVTAAAIYALDYYFLLELTPSLSVQTADVTLWKTLLASFYGGVVEEALMRLFVLSFVAWILAKIFRLSNAAQNKEVMWSAILVAAVIFGLGHLPATAALTAITPAVVARALILNGIGGLVFGWLYWKKGLEYSIAAHFTTDVVLLSILPAIF